MWCRLNLIVRWYLVDNWFCFFPPPLFFIAIIEIRREIQIQQKRSHCFWIHRPCSFGTGSLSSWKPSFTSLQTAHTTVLTKATFQLIASLNTVAEAATGRSVPLCILLWLQLALKSATWVWTVKVCIMDTYAKTGRWYEKSRWTVFSFGHLKHKYSPVSCYGCWLFLIYLFSLTKTVLPYEESYGIVSFFFFFKPLL